MNKTTALILNKEHAFFSLEQSIALSVECLDGERALKALQRFFPAALYEKLPGPFGQEIFQGKVISLVFIVDQDWPETAAEIYPQACWVKARDAFCNDEVWRIYTNSLLAGYTPPSRLLDVFSFGNNLLLASKLAHLVIKGKKRLTAGWVAAALHLGETIPSTGLFSIVTDGLGSPLCLIETLEVEYIQFKDATPTMAIEEGEGDLSLEDWTNGHQRYFEQEGTSLGFAFTPDSLIFIERFRLVHVFHGVDCSNYRLAGTRPSEGQS
ncbi:MAG: ASCH domain-containing protein [Oligoflexia bacterium]|nr:ASCH domain-containing protein [Oligoflexia bacterium]